jgi:hypothetical protein
VNTSAIQLSKGKVTLRSVMSLYKRNTCWIIVEKPKAKRPLGRTKHSLQDNIKTNHQEKEEGGVDWI